jgi:hypothetical protein
LRFLDIPWYLVPRQPSVDFIHVYFFQEFPQRVLTKMLQMCFLVDYVRI